MLRLFVRLGGLFALAGAVIALVVDGTKSIAASALVLTPLSEAWLAVNSVSLGRAESFIEGHLGRFAWEPLATALLGLPVWLVFGAIGALLLLAVRPARLRVAA
ncbi:hypothetical protein SAMN02745157_2715 [Kaistia soli DSM 19436]|uniref:Uncharacterized protein n=1 Tax=Kaistia soli DSM 19436 TaxID=1122133 RepID=A0A1M5DKK7_9HYPH|nr:hypothetical protein [Kaistia soli]SHF67431.1 hypothetical protein SAMN02745157_2715 [Kaistia soli DSM 19436]